MTPWQSQRVREWFDRLVDQPVEARRRALDEAVDEDAVVLDEVRRLLRTHAGVTLDVAGQVEAANALAGATLAPEAAVPSSDGLRIGDAPPGAPRLPGFDLIESIGQGGMGTVWRARQHGTGRDVAVKTMTGAGDWYRARFAAEIALSAKLEHVNIARVYAGGEHEKVGFHAMELITGLPLNMHIALRKPNRRERVELFLQICAGVGYAHQHRVIHRDLKPGNVLVTAEGVAKVLDFGLARDAQTAESARLTIDAGAGTPAYMSPEQAAGTATLADVRSDIFSLGTMLYEMLVGRLPWESGLDVEALRRRIAADPAPAARAIDHSFDPELDAILRRAMQRNVDDRYQSAGDMAADLRRWLAGRPVESYQRELNRPTLYVVRKALARHRGWAVAASLAVITAVSAGGWFVYELDAERRATGRALTEARFLQQTQAMALEAARNRQANLLRTTNDLLIRVSRQLSTGSLPLSARQDLLAAARSAVQVLREDDDGWFSAESHRASLLSEIQLGDMLSAERNYADAATVLRSTVAGLDAIAPERRLPQWSADRTIALTALGRAQLRLAPAEAELTLRRAIRQVDRPFDMQRRRLLPAVRVALGDALVLQDRRDEAVVAYLQAVALLVHQIEEPAHRAMLVVTLRRVTDLLGAPTRPMADRRLAANLLHWSIDLERPGLSSSQLGDRYLRLARLTHAAGDNVAAVDHLRESIDAFDQAKQQPDVRVGVLNQQAEALELLAQWQATIDPPASAAARARVSAMREVLPPTPPPATQSAEP